MRRCRSRSAEPCRRSVERHVRGRSRRPSRRPRPTVSAVDRTVPRDAVARVVGRADSGVGDRGAICRGSPGTVGGGRAAEAVRVVPLGRRDGARQGAERDLMRWPRRTRTRLVQYPDGTSKVITLYVRPARGPDHRPRLGGHERRARRGRWRPRSRSSTRSRSRATASEFGALRRDPQSCGPTAGVPRLEVDHQRHRARRSRARPPSSRRRRPSRPGPVPAQRLARTHRRAARPPRDGQRRRSSGEFPSDGCCRRGA